MVFSLKDISYNINLFNNSEKYVVGLVLIGFSDHTKLKNTIIWIDQYFKNINKKINIKLIPFYDFCHSDIANFKDIVGELELCNNIEITPYFQQYEDIMNVFNSCNFIINMRYHSTLLCLKSGIPCINIIYDIHPHYENKMNYLKEIYNLPDVFISYKNLNEFVFSNCIDYLMKNYNNLHIKEITVSNEIQTLANFEHLKIIKNILGYEEK